MEFAQRHAITDVCILVSDVERSIDFYTRLLGFRLRRRAEGFADFKGAGLTLACWETGHIGKHTGVKSETGKGLYNTAIAVELPNPGEVDATYAELMAKGIVFKGPPANYPWNARCCYFLGPDGEPWELYAWLEGGPVGDLGL